jgi:hypothetical protein
VELSACDNSRAAVAKPARHTDAIYQICSWKSKHGAARHSATLNHKLERTTNGSAPPLPYTGLAVVEETSNGVPYLFGEVDRNEETAHSIDLDRVHLRAAYMGVTELRKRAAALNKHK